MFRDIGRTLDADRVVEPENIPPVVGQPAAQQLEVRSRERRQMTSDITIALSSTVLRMDPGSLLCDLGASVVCTSFTCARALASAQSAAVLEVSAATARAKPIAGMPSKAGCKSFARSMRSSG